MIHTHIYPGMIVGMVAKYLTGIKFVATIQGGDVGDYEEVFGHFGWFFKKIISLSLSRADKIHCVSNFLKQVVIKLGVPAEKIDVIPNGVDITKFSPKAGHQKSSTIRFISTSRFEKKNNLVQLIEVIEELRRNNIDIKLDIFGEGSQEKDIRNKINELGLGNYIKLKGYINHNNLSKILPQYNFFIRLSTQEGFGISFIEAMACGVIPIGTNVGGIIDIISHQQSGYLINLEKDILSQLKSVLNDKKIWQKIRRNAIKSAKEKYAWDSILKKFNYNLWER